MVLADSNNGYSTSSVSTLEREIAWHGLGESVVLSLTKGVTTPSVNDTVVSVKDTYGGIYLLIIPPYLV